MARNSFPPGQDGVDGITPKQPQAMIEPIGEVVEVAQQGWMKLAELLQMTGLELMGGAAVGAGCYIALCMVQWVMRRWGRKKKTGGRRREGGGRGSRTETLPQEGQVTYVFDGDTIEVDGQKVRLIGVDAPESSECSKLHKDAEATETPAEEVLERGKEAKIFVRDRVLGKTVELEVDELAGSQDQYGRHLAHVWVLEDNEKWLLNELLVLSGRAMPTTHRHKYLESLINARRRALYEDRGVEIPVDCEPIIFEEYISPIEGVGNDQLNVSNQEQTTNRDTTSREGEEEGSPENESRKGLDGSDVVNPRWRESYGDSF